MASSKTNRWKLGLFVVLGVAVGFGTLLWLGTAQFRRVIIPFVTYFDESVQGLDIGAPVKFRGVAIGAVSGIKVAPDQRHIEVQIEVFADRVIAIGLSANPGAADRKPLPSNLRTQIGSAGITGVKYVRVDFFDEKSNVVEKLPFEISGNYVPSAPSTMKNLEDSLIEVLNSIPKAVNKTTDTLERVDKAIEDAQVSMLVERVKTTLDHADSKLSGVDTHSLSAKADALLEEARATLAELKRVANDFNKSTEPLKDVLSKIESATVSIEAAVKEAQVGATTASIRSATDGIADATRTASGLDGDLSVTLLNLREAAASIRRLASALERDPQSILFGKTPETPPPTKKP